MHGGRCGSGGGATQEAVLGARPARRVVGGVAVGHALHEVVVVGDGLQRVVVGDVKIPVHADLDEVVADLVRAGELRTRIGGEQFDRRGAWPVQLRMGDQHVRMHLGGIAAPADVAVEVLQVGGLQVAPAALVLIARREIGRGVADLLAVLHLPLDCIERSARRVDLAAVVGEAVLQLHAQRAAERVQPEHRVRADQVHPVDRQIRQQVEVHRVAERRIEAHAVDVDGKPFRRALQRRRLEPVIEQRRLVRIAGSAVEVDAADGLVQRARQVRRGGAAAREVVGRQHARCGRHRVAVDAGAEQRRGADHVDLRQPHHRCVCVGRRGAVGGGRRGRRRLRRLLGECQHRQRQAGRGDHPDPSHRFLRLRSQA